MEFEIGDEIMSRKKIEDARALIAASLIAAWTGATYFSQWSAMDAAMGTARLGHALAMIACAACCMVAGATILALIVVNALDAAAYVRARRERYERVHPYSRDMRLVAPGSGIR